MHFSKTYAQLLLSLPPELRDNAVQYRQLKKVINQIVKELSSLGLKPEILQECLANGVESPADMDPLSASGLEGETLNEPPGLDSEKAATSNDPPGKSSDINNERIPRPYPAPPKVVYELNQDSGRIEPQLRIWVNVPSSLGVHDGPARSPAAKFKGKAREVIDDDSEEHAEVVGGDIEAEESAETPAVAAARGHTTTNMTPTLLWALQKGLDFSSGSGTAMDSVDADSLSDYDAEFASTLDLSTLSGTSAAHTTTREVVIPLVHDTEFFNMLSTTLETVSTHLNALHSEFEESLTDLARTIGDTSRPASVAAHFHPYSSVEANAGAIRVKSENMKSDLYSWREIFQLYVEAEVFENVSEVHRGERDVEDSEKRLKLFAERVTARGLGDGRKFKLKQSVEALEHFLGLNLFILNIKKLSHANSEATRKILKKHAKRTALPLPGVPLNSSQALSAPLLLQQRHQPILALIANSSASSLPRILVQAIGETLLPIVPSVEDYSCLICTSLAFKPIRLSCGHLFCVRCLVKMQKRGKGNCPMCRAPSVLVANRTNVDWGLLNFMQDWFPVEAREKLKANEKEAAEEQMRELGMDPDQPCRLM